MRYALNTRIMKMITEKRKKEKKTRRKRREREIKKTRYTPRNE